MTSDDRVTQRRLAGQWLREQRERHGFASAAELGRVIGATKEVVWSYEAGRSSVPDERAERIARAFGLGIIEVRRNLGLWVPPQTSDDELTEPEDDPELLKLIRQARRERDNGDPTLYKMLLRLQGLTEQGSGGRADEAPGGKQQAS